MAWNIITMLFSYTSLFISLNGFVIIFYTYAQDDKSVISKLEQDVDFQLTLSLLDKAKDSSTQVRSHTYDENEALRYNGHHQTM